MDLSRKLLSLLAYIDFVTELVELIRKFASSQPENMEKNTDTLITTLLSSASDTIAQHLSLQSGEDPPAYLVQAKEHLAMLISEYSTRA